MQIALPYEFMGTQSNGNPYCGKALTIKNPTTGQTISATVGDKCMGCTGRSIDLTEALFNAIGGGCDGRCSGFEWWFN
jgi:gentisate 1,2-dioxygenase